jgi:general secretion pathway protein I
MMLASPARAPRHGLSLLEILVALAIFLFSIVALHQALNLGTNSAIEMQQLVQAAQLAQSKMAELYVGAVPLQSQGDTPFDEDPDFTWSVDAQQNTVQNLWNVTVTVTRTRGDGSKTETKLSQMIMDPSLRGTSYDAAATAAASTSASSSTSGSGSSSSASGASSAGSSGTTGK